MVCAKECTIMLYSLHLLQQMYVLLLEAFDKNDKNSIYSYSLILEILEDSENYKKEVIDVAHQTLDEVLNGKK